ncbi:odorant receptor [Holotrichia oblita]|uniref:Odorant receptor n=1 Tax=Holotrichia oblita TaxID=644536 RepID=A0ACB9SQD4_HOLOL|nr:odorant receptor [Holotrichia oblita]
MSKKSNSDSYNIYFTAFTYDILQDNAKKWIIPGKWILQTILVWPDSNNAWIISADWLIFINIIIIEILHASFVIINRSDLGIALVALATVTTTFEILHDRLQKYQFNDILCKVWKQFWPLSILPQKDMKNLSKKCYITVMLAIGCYGPAVLCNMVITLTPYLTREQILKSTYPFQWNSTYTYEKVDPNQFLKMLTFAIAHMFQLFNYCYVGNELIIQSGNMANAIYNCNWELINDEKFKMTLTFMIQRCQKQQRLTAADLQLEEVFRFAILFQFVNSTAALCSSTVVLQVDSSQFMEMLTFAIAHMFQLFYYCFVGNELTVQSGNMAIAIYDCNWQLSEDLEFKKGLILMLQRSQRAQTMTAAGIIDLNFESYISVPFHFELLHIPIYYNRIILGFNKDVYKDCVKRSLLPGKVLLQGVCCWPDNEDWYMRFIGWFIFWNLIFIEIFHTAYALKNFKNIGDAVTVGATVTTTMEGLVRLYIMLTKKEVLNDILVKIWKQFWPADTLEPKKQKLLKQRAQIAVLLTSFFLLCSCVSNSQIVGLPYLRSHDMLLKSAFPFDWNKLYVYEILYIYQYFLDCICTELENSFNIAIMIQFFVSTCGICASVLMLKVDYSQFVKMLTFAAGHTAQLFYYCYVGHELIFESGYLSVAIYECDWHISYDKNFNQALILMMQRGQKVQCLTAAGVTELNFVSFIKCLVRFYIIVFKKPIINEILFNIWKNFWPLSVVSPRNAHRLTNKCYITLALTFGCYGPALVCNTIVTLGAYFTKTGLAFSSEFPFQWNQTYVYETIYFWQYVTAWYILILVNSFDFFMIPMVMICAVQFGVLQNVFKNMLSDKSKRQRKILYGEVISDRKMFLRWLNQQRMLIR